MNLLLDVNIVLDICAVRTPFVQSSAGAVQKCIESGGKIWLYVGSVQTIEYSLVHALHLRNKGLTKRQLVHLARQALNEFAENKHWLAALADEGNVLEAQIPKTSNSLSPSRV